MTPEAMLAAAPAAKEALSRLTPVPLHELSEILGDRVRLWRWKNQLRILEQAKAYADECGLDLKAISFKALVPLLEGSSLEDEPALQQSWARLIANASASNAPLGVTRFAAELLRGITTHEARVIEGMIANIDQRHQHGAQVADAHRGFWGMWMPPRNGVDLHVSIPIQEMDHVGLGDHAYNVAIDNLVRYNVIRVDELRNMDGTPVTDACSFTRLGWEAVQLLRARHMK